MKTHVWKWKILQVTLNAGLKGICRKKIYTKGIPGMRRKRQPWVEYVNSYPDDEFERLLELGVKVTRSLLWEISLTSIALPKSPFQSTRIDTHSNKFIHEEITREFIEIYCQRRESRTVEFRVIFLNPLRLPSTPTS